MRRNTFEIFVVRLTGQDMVLIRLGNIQPDSKPCSDGIYNVSDIIDNHTPYAKALDSFRMKRFE